MFLAATLVGWIGGVSVCFWKVGNQEHTFYHFDVLFIMIVYHKCRRQKEIVTPALFEMAVSSNADGIYSILEDEDFVNPQVICCACALTFRL